MKASIILNMISILYTRMLRDILVKAVADTTNELDDYLVNMLDSIFLKGDF